MTAIAFLARAFDAALPFETWQLRYPDGTPYLTRHVLWGANALENHDPEAPSSAFVHEIHAPDGDRHCHNHSWRWSASVVLSGGYTEERDNSGREVEWTHRAGDLVTFRTDDYHRIVAVEPGTVTLFLCGRETQGWGFLVDGVHVDHAEYFARPDVSAMRTVRVR
jgi:hypothetical protein